MWTYFGQYYDGTSLFMRVSVDTTKILNGCLKFYKEGNYLGLKGKEPITDMSHWRKIVHLILFYQPP